MWKPFLSLWKIRIERGYDPAAQNALADLILDGGPDLRKMHFILRRILRLRLASWWMRGRRFWTLHWWKMMRAIFTSSVWRWDYGAFAAQSEAELQSELYERLVWFEEYLIGDARDQAYLAGLSNTQRPEAAQRIMDFARNAEDAHTLAAIDFVGDVAQPDCAGVAVGVFGK